MSLIEEALRRIQQEPIPPTPRQEAPGTAPPQATTPAPRIRTRAPSTNIITAFAFASIGLGVLAIGLAGGSLWMSRQMLGRKGTATLPSARGTSQVTSTPRVAAEPVATSSAEPAVKPEVVVPAKREPLRLRSQPPQLELNGIVEGVGEPLALINGRIVRLGETVQDATLLEVKDDTVRLRWHNEELVLRTSP